MFSVLGYKIYLSFNKVEAEKAISYRDLAMPFIIGLVCFWYVIGLEKLIPSNNIWLMSNDWATQYLGWEFFRTAPISFPFGKIDNYFAPFGTTISYTDSYPLFSIIVKLFSWMLPEYAQITGWWFFLCWILIAYFSNVLLKELRIENFWYRSLGVLFISFAPVLLARVGHPTLCAQWIIIASIWNYFRKKEFKKVLLLQVLFVFISAGVHPYFLVMTIVASFGIVSKHLFYTKQVSTKEAILAGATFFVVSFITMYSFGYFTISSSSMQADEYGVYSANLNSFFNPMGLSHFLRPLPIHHNEQGDAFAFVGLGLLIGIPLLFYFARPSLTFLNYNNKNFPLVISGIILLLLAVSTKITFSDFIIYEFQNVNLINKMGGFFRASGRFIWFAHYLVIIGFIVILYRSIKKPRYSVLFLSGVFLVQFADIRSIGQYPQFQAAAGTYTFPGQDTLRKLIANTDRIVFYRPFERTLIHPDDYINFAYLAAKLNKPITTGYVARYNFDEAEVYKNSQLPDSIRSGLITNSLYVTNDTYVVEFFNVLTNGKAVWFKDNGYNYILSSANELAKTTLQQGKYIQYDKLVDFFERNSSNFIIAVVQDEGSANLSEASKVYLTSRGSQISQISYRGSYLLLMKDGKIIHEQVNAHQPVSVNFSGGTVQNGILFPKSVEVHSAGANAGSYSKIIVNGQGYSEGKRGFNLAAFDGDFNLVEKINIDTHFSPFWVKYEEAQK